MPYAPGTEYRGDQYVAQGQTALWKTLGEFVQNKLDEDKQRARKFDALMNYADAAGIMPKDTAKVLSLDELEGKVQGYAAKQGFEKAAADLARAKQEQDDRNALSGFIRDFATGDMSRATNVVPPTVDAPVADWSRFAGALKDLAASAQPANRLDFALARNPGAGAAPQFDNTLSALARFGGVGDESVYQVHEGTTKRGTPYVTFGHNFEFDPAATAETRQQNQVDLLNQREKLRDQRAQELTSKDLLTSYQQDMKALDTAWDMPPEERAARRKEIQTQIDKLRGTKTSAPDAPRNPKDRKANTVYATPKGELKWTGTGWVTP